MKKQNKTKNEKRKINKQKKGKNDKIWKFFNISQKYLKINRTVSYQYIQNYEILNFPTPHKFY